MTRVTLEEKLSVRCPWCGARPGAECRDLRLLWPPDHRRSLCNVPHRERREAFLQRWRRAEWMRTHPGACPCESELDDPGEHIEACPWNDPDYDDGGLP